MSILVLIVVTAVAPVLAAPAPPWWVGPAERILSAWGSALIVALVPVSATVIRGMISHKEHQETKAAIVENTGLTVQGVNASKEAVEVGNNMNGKLLKTLQVIEVQQAQVQARQDRNGRKTDAESGERRRDR